MTTKPRSLTAAARAAFTAMRASAPRDRFYFFALTTTEDGRHVGATAWSEEALARTIDAFRVRDPHWRAEGHRRRLRFHEPDSPFHGEPFADFAPDRKLHDACFDALRELDGDAFFGKGMARSKTLINVVYPDMTDRRWLENADRLNSRAALARALPFLDLGAA